MTTFAQILEAADSLSPDEREELVEQLRKREIARRREEIIAGVAESEREFAEGRARAGTPEQIMNEILSCDDR